MAQPGHNFTSVMAGRSLEIISMELQCVRRAAGQPSNGGPKYTIDTSVLPYTAETEGYSCLSGSPVTHCVIQYQNAQTIQHNTDK